MTRRTFDDARRTFDGDARSAQLDDARRTFDGATRAL
jgi:hypothetical protein